ncbi:hypothetical protein TSUD_187710 [Trifolium subterraneum]|uniref:Uncharacterized protein n=1 Tax=Trifolium subterraneum TaxID=3900 RepID=A0A2Z6PKJ4_TRISU|nr:hypothetical protein TSUD_187710 [Trifolium subterraneum]
MESSDHVVLFIDQQINPKPSTMEAETHNNNTQPHQEKPKHPLRAKTLNRLSFSKPKSRILEYSHPHRNQLPTTDEENTQLPSYKISSDDEDDNDYEYKEEESEDDYDEALHDPKLNNKKKKFKDERECFSSLCVGCIIGSTGRKRRRDIEIERVSFDGIEDNARGWGKVEEDEEI